MAHNGLHNLNMSVSLYFEVVHSASQTCFFILMYEGLRVPIHAIDFCLEDPNSSSSFQSQIIITSSKSVKDFILFCLSLYTNSTWLIIYSSHDLCLVISSLKVQPEIVLFIVVFQCLPQSRNLRKYVLHKQTKKEGRTEMSSSALFKYFNCS